MTIKDAIKEIGELNPSTNSLQQYVFNLLQKGKSVEAVFHYRKAQEFDTWNKTDEENVATRCKRINKINRKRYGQGWPISKLKKLTLLKQQDYRCNICKEKNRPWDADHIIPASEGGTNDITNIQIVCRPCHIEKDAHLINKSNEEQIII